MTRDYRGKKIPFHDLTGMPENEKQEVMRRLKYVEKALEYTRYEQSTARVEKAIEDVAEELSETVVKKDEKASKHKKKGWRVGEAT